MWMRTPTIVICVILTFGFTTLGCNSSSSTKETEPSSKNSENKNSNSQSNNTANKQVSTTNKDPDKKPVRRTVRRRAIQVDEISKVLLSDGHKKMCLVQVGDQMPAIGLQDTSGNLVELKSLYGERLSVVVFWKGDRALARWMLADLGPDVLKPFGSQGVNVVGVAVEMDEASVVDQLKVANASFKNLLDEEGTAFALVGSGRLPRVYLLDPDGKILWFDIEYSSNTRKELLAAIRYVMKQK